jgi:hypothetical protein
MAGASIDQIAMDVYSTSAGFADEWLFAEPRDPASVQRRQRLNGGAVDIARRLDQSQSHSDVGLPPLGCADGDRLIACGDIPLQIGRDTRRNINLDNSPANVAVRLDVFTHLQ